MTNLIADILLQLFALATLVAFVVILIHQGSSIGYQRNGYSRRDTRRDHAIMRARLENILHRNNKRY